ncbi:MAG: hypothetical protein IJ568_08100 [Bacilli bacterium]|nr:hypothetical protein [Bacilli bacterium]
MFYYDEDRMTDMLSVISKNIREMSEMEDGYLDKMTSFTESGLYGNGIQMIDSQIVSIKDGLTDFKNITKNNMTAFTFLERKLSSETDNISLPHDFDAEDVGFDISVNNTYLTKIDGRSVNEGVLNNDARYVDEHQDNIQNLFKLHKEEITDKNLDEYHDIKDNDLFKLHEEELTDNMLDDYKETNEVGLYNANYNNDIYNSEFEDNYDIDRQDLDKVNEGDENGN